MDIITESLLFGLLVGICVGFMAAAALAPALNCQLP